MEFSKQEYWSGWPFPSPGDLPNQGIEPGSPALQANSLPSEPPGTPYEFSHTTSQFPQDPFVKSHSFSTSLKGYLCHKSSVLETQVFPGSHPAPLHVPLITASAMLHTDKTASPPFSVTARNPIG